MANRATLEPETSRSRHSQPVLLVDPNPARRGLLKRALENKNFSVVEATDTPQSIRAIQANPRTLVLLAMNSGAERDIEVLSSIRQLFDLPILVYGPGEDSVAAFRAGRQGASEYISWSTSNSEEVVRVAEKFRSDNPGPIERRGSHRVLGRSLSASHLRRQIERLAKGRAPVLVTGEVGSEIEEVVRAIHEESGREPFVSISVPELSETVLDSRLFGEDSSLSSPIVRTGLVEEADGGTLFINGICHANREVQGRLVQLLQSRSVRRIGQDQCRPVDVRVVASCDRTIDVLEQVEELLPDLLGRLRETLINVPSLRERASDVPDVAKAELANIADLLGIDEPQVDPGFYSVVEQLPWPGNRVQLRSVLHNLLLEWNQERLITEQDLVKTMVSLDPRTSVDQVLECHRMLEAFRSAGGNQEAARRKLGLSRGQWRERWSRYDMQPLSKRRSLS